MWMLLVPPTLRTDLTRSAGCTQKAVLPTTLSPRPRSNSNSVRLGTSETMRAASADVGRCSFPMASMSGSVMLLACRRSVCVRL